MLGLIVVVVQVAKIVFQALKKQKRIYVTLMVVSALIK